MLSLLEYLVCSCAHSPHNLFSICDAHKRATQASRLPFFALSSTKQVSRVYPPRLGKHDLLLTIHDLVQLALHLTHSGP